MAAQQFLLDSDNAGGLNQFLLNSDDPLAVTISITPQQSQQSDMTLVDLAPAISISPKQAQQASVAVITWSYTTLADPIYYGVGSIANPGQFIGGAAKAGDVVAYDASNPPGLLVGPDGSLSWLAYGSSVAQYNDGTGWVPLTITVAPWGVVSNQGQQISVSLAGAPAIEITAQQAQQGNFNVSQVGQVAITSQQPQQVVVVVRASVQVGFSSQQPEQTGVSISVKPQIVASPQQRQQAAADIKASPAIAMTVQQGQQATVNIVAPQAIAIAATMQQPQQGAASIRAVPVVTPITTQQPQQSSVDVRVPQPVAIAMTAQQAQQGDMAVAARPVLSLVSSQPQQSDFGVQAFPNFEFESQQAQQVTVVLPTLPAPVIETGPYQQGQQFVADLVGDTVISIRAFQSQQGSFDVSPQPGQLPDLDSEGITFDYMTNPYDSQPYTKVVYLDRDNATNLGVLYYGQPLILGPVTKILMNFPELGITLSSADSGEYMQWNYISNVIKFKLGGAPIPKGVYTVSLVLFDIAHPRGQVIAGPAGEFLMFDFAQDMAVA